MEAVEFRAALTFDLHDVDEPEDIRHAAETFSRAGLPATFFIPSAMLEMPRYREVLARLPELGHEAGSHSHGHGRDEFHALKLGDVARLDFLAKAHDLHASFFGRPPTAFRAPFWGRIAPAAAQVLAKLGYLVDSSATPQRLPFLGSSPFDVGWMFAPRSPFELAPGLLEIPTSCLGIPAATQAYLTIRQRASIAFLEILRLEARITRNRILVTSFHVEDFNPESRRNRKPGRLEPLDWIPLPTGGVGLRYHFLETDPARILKLSEAVVAWFSRLRCSTMTGLAEGLRPGTA